MSQASLEPPLAHLTLPQVALTCLILFFALLIWTRVALSHFNYYFKKETSTWTVTSCNIFCHQLDLQLFPANPPKVSHVQHFHLLLLAIL